MDSEHLPQFEYIGVFRGLIIENLKILNRVAHFSSNLPTCSYKTLYILHVYLLSVPQRQRTSKERFLALMAICCVATLTLHAGRVDYSVAPGCMFVDPENEAKQLESTKEEPFDMTGTIVKYESAICMQRGVDYEVRSADQKQRAWLSVSAADEAPLKIAMENGRLVHVTGAWRQSAECRYVKVTDVQPVEKEK